ncbi:MAG: DUF1684 domain-containing protein [Saprospiraceae bacterium]
MKKVYTYYHLVFCLLTFAVSSCNHEPLENREAYLEEVEAWRSERIAELTAPTGWLALAGLFWLEEGENTFGSGLENQLIFPKKAPSEIGRFMQKGDSVWVEIAQGVDIKVKEEVIQTMGLSGQASPLIMEYGSLSWFLLQRSHRYGIRLIDSLHEARQQFKHIDHYPVDPKGKVPAKLVAFEQPETLLVRNVLDMEIPYPTEGKLVFNWEGKEASILVLDGGPAEYFLIFADATTGDETYPSGRYLYTPKVDSSGLTYIDFNKAYNPPCAFTEYATCLLPPAANRLEVAIRYGEKNYGMH